MTPLNSVRTVRRKAKIDRARQLRRDHTRAEAYLWSALHAHRLGGWRWKRQLPFGHYFRDFACTEARLVVDGDSHADEEAEAYDARRTAHLERADGTVIHFWNSEVLTNRNGVCLKIMDARGGDRSDA